MQHNTTSCNTLQHIATHLCLGHLRLDTRLSYFTFNPTHYNTLQQTATDCEIRPNTATHCNTLQHTATHCNTPQHPATHAPHLQSYAARHQTITFDIQSDTLQHAATRCNTLQHAATHLCLVHMRLHTRPSHLTLNMTHYNTLQHTATQLYLV